MRSMKKYKKQLLIVLSILFVPILVIRNLYKHSAYYAQFTPHREGVEPVPMMLVDHCHDIHYFLDDFGADCYENGYYIRRDYKAGNSVSLQKGSHDEGYYYINHKGIAYELDNDFKVRYAVTSDGIYIPTSEEEVEVKEEIMDAFLPVVKRQWPPLLNLQWLFDWVYHDRFN